MSRGTFSHVGRYAAGLGVIVSITFFYHHYFFFKTTTIVLTYLLAILAVSTFWGMGVSIFLSIVATMLLDYFFFPPYGSFTINDPQNWVALTSFLATAAIGSYLSTQARREAESASRQRNELQRLYNFSRALLNPRNPVELLNEIPKQIVESFQADSAALYMSDLQRIYRSGADTLLLDAGRLKGALTGDGFREDSRLDAHLAPVKLQTKTLGSFGVVGSTVAQQTLEAMGTLIATAIDRARAIEQVGKAEAARERERFKSVLLDAITHDFRTPLTSIKGSVTSMLAGVKLSEHQKHEFLVIIEEECDRINRLVGEAGEMSRLEAGEVAMTLESYRAADLISAALADCESIRGSRPVHVEVPHGLRVRADLFWVKKAFANLMKNADAYSSPGKPISIRAEEKGDFVLFHVADEGPGIEAAEIDEIFGRFYRGKQHRLARPGTGLGLPIAKAIIEAQGGTIGVVSQVGEGSVFTFSLPIDRAPTQVRDF
jgi:two-component system, OmpR family, sensor histidine kinase KdpD